MRICLVLTKYQHFANQGYVLDLDGDTLNFPNTCTGRNSCSAASGGLASTGDPVPTYDLQALVELMVDLVDE